jgi:hypothetical protein
LRQICVINFLFAQLLLILSLQAFNLNWQSCLYELLLDKVCAGGIKRYAVVQFENVKFGSMDYGIKFKLTKLAK